MHIPIVLGTARTGRQSEKVAKTVESLLGQNEGLSTEVVDIRDHIKAAATVPFWGDDDDDLKATDWRSIVAKSDALVLVIPEYNRGYPGELKLLLDSLYEEYCDLPVGLVGVSSGIFGGARVIEHIKPVLIELQMHPISPAVHILKVEETFSDSGEATDERTTATIQKMIDRLVDLAKRLKT